MSSLVEVVLGKFSSRPPVTSVLTSGTPAAPASVPVTHTEPVLMSSAPQRTPVTPFGVAAVLDGSGATVGVVSSSR